MLDAPDMLDDFYLHLIDWSSLNHMAVALCHGMYIWNATDGNILELFQKEGEDQFISSVKWIKVRHFVTISLMESEMENSISDPYPHGFGF